MHKYFVEIYEYTVAGALNPRASFTQTCDNEIQLRAIRDRYAYERQDNGMAKYKVKAYKLKYTEVSNLDAEISGMFE